MPDQEKSTVVVTGGSGVVGSGAFAVQAAKRTGNRSVAIQVFMAVLEVVVGGRV